MTDLQWASKGQRSKKLNRARVQAEMQADALYNLDLYGQKLMRAQPDPTLENFAVRPRAIETRHAKARKQERKHKHTAPVYVKGTHNTVIASYIPVQERIDLQDLAKHVIGRKFKNLNNIMRDSGAHLQMLRGTNTLEIRGSNKACTQAKALVWQCLREHGDVR